MARRDLALALTLAAFATDGAAQDWTEQVSRGVETPAHRWLEKLRREPGTQLDGFTTDGCSGGMSSLWSYVAAQYPAFAEAHGGRPPWEACCVTHDRAYHDAGPDPSPDASYDARLAADTALRACVEETADARDAILTETYGLSAGQVRAVYAGISEAMFQAVRLGGGPCTGLSWRWGYGYPQCWQIERDK